MITCSRHYDCLVPRRLSLIPMKIRLYAKPCKKRSAWGRSSHYDYLVVLEWRRLSRFPAKMTLVYARAILSMEKISSHSLKLYVDPTDNFIQKWVLIYHPKYMTKLWIQASSLGHALINCVFTVLFKKRGRSVVCDLGVFFVCLFVFIPFHKKV